jgi:hypothetical protein
MDINSYVQVLYNIASIELKNENEAGELEVDVVNDEIVEILDLMLAAEDVTEVSDNQAVQKGSDFDIDLHQPNTVEYVPTQEELDSEHVGPPEMYLGDTVVDEMESIDNLIQAQNLIQDAKSVGTTEPSLFDDVDAKKERLEEIRTELDNETVSYGELAELQDLTEYIEEGDVQLLEAASVPEFPEEETVFADELVEETFAFPNLVDDVIIPALMSEEQIEMVKEEHGIVETGSPDDGFIGSTDESPESLFDLMDEYDESQGEEVPWFTDENATDKVDLAPSLIPDSMREAVSEILADKYQGKRSVVNTIEDTDYMIFELDSKEFFVVDK